MIFQFYFYTGPTLLINPYTHDIHAYKNIVYKSLYLNTLFVYKHA